MTNIFPNLLVKKNLLDRKLIESPFFADLKEPDFFPAFRSIKSDLSSYHSENNNLLGEESILQNQYTQIAAGQSITYEGRMISMDEASELLKSKDRSLREEIFRKVAEVRRSNMVKQDELLSKLVALRHRIAVNAGFKNYIGYKFAEWKRFDYSIAECGDTWAAIAEEVTPQYQKIQEIRKNKLGIDTLRPWDTRVNLTDRPPLRPSESSDELLNKVLTCLDRLDPYFAGCIQRLKDMNHLDIEPRLNKLNGAAYNTDMPETGVPFIMQNVSNSSGDVFVMLHESGHAIHSMLKSTLPYSFFKQPPLEVCEVASKAMEMMSMDHIDIFYADPADQTYAKRVKLEMLLWSLTIYASAESFQMWLYENPDHTVAERHVKWLEYDRKFTNTTDYSGLEDIHCTNYQDNMAIYTLPFYMSAYIFSDFGAIAMWRNFKKDRQKTIAQYKTALSMGNTRTIQDLYLAAGIRFEFSREYIRELMDFVQQEIAHLS